MRIEIGKRKRFHVAEKFATHIALYFYAQHVPEIGYDIRENAFYNVDERKYRRPHDNEV